MSRRHWHHSRPHVRAHASEATGQRILETAHQLFGGQLYNQVSLQAVEDSAGVTVQTDLRRFTCKERLFAAVTQRRDPQLFDALCGVRPENLSQTPLPYEAGYNHS